MRSRQRRTAEELDALLDGRLSPEDVHGEGRRLAGLATTVVEEHPGPVATLTEDRRLAMRDRLLDDIAALDAPAVAAPGVASPAGRFGRSARAAVASGVASVLIAGTGATVAAQEALPGDVLYGLKKGTESVRMNLAGDATQAARLELRFAEERLEEITVGADELSPESLVDSLAEMDHRSVAGAQQLVLAAERGDDGELLAEVDAFVERQSAGVVELFTRLPIEVRPYAEDSLATLRRIRTELLVPASEACDCIDVVPASHQKVTDRLSSEPLPPPPSSPEPEEPSASEQDGGEETTSQDETSELREPLGDISRERETSSDHDGSRLRESGEGLEDTVDDTLDTSTDGLNSTTDGVDDAVEETGETVEGTVDDVAGSVDETTDSVGDLLGSTDDGDGGRLDR